MEEDDRQQVLQKDQERRELDQVEVQEPAESEELLLLYHKTGRADTVEKHQRTVDLQVHAVKGT